MFTSATKVRAEILGYREPDPERGDITSIPSLPVGRCAGPDHHEGPTALGQTWKPPAVDAARMISVDGHFHEISLESGIWGIWGIREIPIVDTHSARPVLPAHRVNDVS